MDCTKDQGTKNVTKGKGPMKGIKDDTNGKEGVKTTKDNTKGKDLVKGIKGKGKKRPRSPTPISEQALAVEVEQPSTKKRNDVQTAKSDSLMIPVDETCPLAGKESDHSCF